MGCVCQKTSYVLQIGQKSDTNNMVNSLKDSEKQLIRKQWSTLKRHVANVGVITFIRYE